MVFENQEGTHAAVFAAFDMPIICKTKMPDSFDAPTQMRVAVDGVDLVVAFEFDPSLKSAAGYRIPN